MSEQGSKRVSLKIGTSLPGDVSKDKAASLGIGEWQLSPDAVERIENFETNRRAAQLQSGHLLAF